MKKLLLLLLLCAVGVTNLVALSFDDGYLRYTVNADGTTVTVNGRKSGITASGSLSIPSTVTYNNITYTVTAIDDWAFQGASGYTGTLTLLPKTVGRNGTSITNNCNYWSSTHSSGDNAYCIYFGGNYVGFSNCMNNRSTGNPMRLVNPVNN